ncbi:hypothetical protein [Ruegeria sp. HKCCD6119]|uniref:hypothetical protein n=1 Tax=Ruegeria sp. HKCCD6119 TaxID=2683003 RepID=UPI0014916EEF|nr:hypothetical protein [Ruegeria sp. HKCCD6119]NOD84453.1 hypothetical protein [Ruegeria sp. HKCCD6119]
MPLEILLTLVVGGIAGVTLLLHLTGKSQQVMLTPDIARSQWARHFPDDDVVDVTVSHDGHAAMVRTSSGNGLLWSFGADTVARHLLDYDLLDHPEGFEILFHEFSVPKTLIRLDDFERHHWRDLMEPA